MRRNALDAYIAKNPNVSYGDAVRACARVFLEAYTSILTVGTDRLEALYGKSVTVADRETVESVS